MIPLEPPSISPITSNSPLRAPSSNAVFNPFGMVVFYRSRSRLRSAARNAARHGRSSMTTCSWMRVRAIAARTESV